MARAEYKVVIRGGQWMIHYEGKDYGPYASQKGAIKAAIQAAYTIGKKGNEAQVLLQGTDNKFLVEWTYGVDPYPPRD